MEMVEYEKEVERQGYYLSAEVGSKSRRRSLMEPGVISQRPVERGYARYYRSVGGGGSELSLKALKIISGESCAHVIHGGEEGKKGGKQGEGRGGLVTRIIKL